MAWDISLILIVKVNIKNYSEWCHFGFIILTMVGLSYICSPNGPPQDPLLEGEVRSLLVMCMLDVTKNFSS